MTEHEVRFTGWSHGPQSVPRAIYEVDPSAEDSFVVALSLPETVRARLASEHQRDDENDEEFLTRLQEALRAYGEEVVDEVAGDPGRAGSARRDGHFTHEVAGHEVGRLTELLSA